MSTISPSAARSRRFNLPVVIQRRPGVRCLSHRDGVDEDSAQVSPAFNNVVKKGKGRDKSWCDGGAKRRVDFTDLSWTEEIPSENDIDFKDLAKEHLTDANGSNFRLSEFSPDGTPSPFHWSIMRFYGIVLSRSITLFLDDNKRLALNSGDVLAKRGTIHDWVNEGTEWARVFFVMLPSKNVQIGDRELGP